MKATIIDIIKRKGSIALTALKNYVEANGEYDFYFPAKNIEETNILLICNVNKEFVKAISEMIDQEVISIEGTSLLIVAADVGEIYPLPIARGKIMKYDAVHWLPLLLTKGQNFPN